MMIDLGSDTEVSSDTEVNSRTEVSPDIDDNSCTEISEKPEKPEKPEMPEKPEGPERPEEPFPRQNMRNLLAKAAEKRLKRAKMTTSETTASETDIEVVSTVPTSIFRSPIRLIGNPAYCEEFCRNGDKDTVSLSDLIGSPLLEKTYQFNFLIDCQFLLKFLKADPVNVELILIGVNDNDHLQLDESQKFSFRIKTIDVSKKLPKFGSHHTKLMVNLFQDDTCQIVVHTMNLTVADYAIQTQMCWVSPRLSKLHKDQWRLYQRPDLDPLKDTGDIFKKDLISYLESYEESLLSELIGELESFDFTPIRVQFVGSSPGKYTLDSSLQKYSPDTVSKTFGFGKLYQWIKIYGLDTCKGEMVGQSSTIASPFDSKKSNIFTHVLTGVAEGRQPVVKEADHEFIPKCGLQPIIVWPTVREILKSKATFLSGHALHFKVNRIGKYAGYAEQYRNIQQFLHKWSSGKDSELSKAGRSHLSPHVKTYCVTEDHFKSLNWFLLSSANISSQAWGRPFKKLKHEPPNICKYRVSSYEVGILINPKTIGGDEQPNLKLVPVFGKDTVQSTEPVCPVRLPYDVPLQKYSASDEPWTTEKLVEIESSLPLHQG
ncbi:hypothetical protein FOA43_001584 [Brettanomyces nanus]|uniref:Tyrosyl-DNA phosphodiesterase 1 n=1 Tax=Eeniella nana TaxID=13502 RepID=A0A875S373_EENNA|nr:uncharacterized protein FOA43_001584 [Brettanomyces nanus]QPG74259.1 hypothetical protein FOA43_001584 [Brettanomyces nanus]